MIDCPNVEMRDRLPDLANDLLAPGTRDEVLAHLAGCEPCTAEIEILRTTRLIMRATTPRVNVASVVLALPSYEAVTRDGSAAGAVATSRGLAARPAGARSPVAGQASGRGWGNSWRIAAATAFLAAGIGSYAMLRDGAVAGVPDSVANVAAAIPDNAVGMALTGALADLSDAELSALAGEIENIEALPSTEVDRMASPVAGPAILPDSVVQNLEVP